MLPNQTTMPSCLVTCLSWFVVSAVRTKLIFGNYEVKIGLTGTGKPYDNRTLGRHEDEDGAPFCYCNLPADHKKNRSTPNWFWG